MWDRRLLDRFEVDVRPREAPWFVEKAVLWGLYFVGFTEASFPLAVRLHVAPPLLQWAVAPFVASTVLCFLALAWAVFLRPARMPLRFVSHVHWLAMTHAWVMLASAAAALTFIVALLLVAVVRPAAAVLVYAPLGLAALAYVWFVYRILRGAVALVLGRPVGALRFAALLEEDPPRDGSRAGGAP